MLLMKILKPLNKRTQFCTRNLPRFFCLGEKEDVSNELQELITSDEEYNKLADHYFQIKQAHRCLVIQPYVKWGRNKLKITPDEQLSEAIALINTLPAWTVEDTVAVPLDTLDRKALLKSGSMERIKNLVRENSNFSAIFINAGSLKKITINILQENFHRPIFDRYNIVMQILKAHATSKHAKLQVALAELYYVRRKSEKDLFFRSYDSETLRLMFQEREQKLKNEIKNLRHQRNILRNKRQKMDYPVVAVVGYTNAGKTSIIKSLTGEESLKPKNQLFATLDVTVHKGKLPSGLEVLYIDTVGFISDIPTNLIECFVATLEDALLADVILHVEDISSKSYEYKRNHVLQTLERLQIQAESKNVLGKVIAIGNKCDLVDHPKADVILVSAEKGHGLDELKHQLESFILYVTGRKKITIRTSNGGDGIRWLHKNATVLEEIPDQDNLQYVFVRVIITAANLDKFKHHFLYS